MQTLPFVTKGESGWVLKPPRIRADPLALQLLYWMPALHDLRSFPSIPILVWGIPATSDPRSYIWSLKQHMYAGVSWFVCPQERHYVNYARAGNRVQEEPNLYLGNDVSFWLYRMDRSTTMYGEGVRWYWPVTVWFKSSFEWAICESVLYRLFV